MNQLRSSISAVALTLTAIASCGALAQTSTTAAGATNTSSASSSTSSTTSSATSASSSSHNESQYLKRIAPRFEAMAGSRSNLESLVHGLRTGSEVKLTSTSGASGSGTAASSSGASVAFTPATRPMGYGNITRALYLANQQLAAAGVKNPTPQDLAAALNGGTVKTAQGTTTFKGVLTLRSQGMGWGQVAHAIGVHPGMGRSDEHHADKTVSGTGVTTASGASSARGEKEHERAEHGKGVVTASGSTRSTASGNERPTSGKVANAAGAGTASQTSGKGIVTAGSAVSTNGSSHATRVQPGSGVATASGAANGSGVTTASAAKGQSYGPRGKD